MICSLCPAPPDDNINIDANGNNGNAERRKRRFSLRSKSHAVQQNIVLPGNINPSNDNNATQNEVDAAAVLPDPVNAINNVTLKYKTVKHITAIPFINRFDEGRLAGRFEECAERFLNSRVMINLAPITTKIDRLIDKLMTITESLIPCLRPDEEVEFPRPPLDEDTERNRNGHNFIVASVVPEGQSIVAPKNVRKLGGRKACILIRTNANAKKDKIKIRQLGRTEQTDKIISMITNSTVIPGVDNNQNLVRISNFDGGNVVIAEDESLRCFEVIYFLINSTNEILMTFIDSQSLIYAAVIGRMTDITSVIEGKLYPLKKCIMNILNKPLDEPEAIHPVITIPPVDGGNGNNEDIEGNIPQQPLRPIE